MTMLVTNVSSAKTQLLSALSLKCGDSSHNFWQHIQIPKLEKGHMTTPNALTLLLSPKNSPDRGRQKINMDMGISKVGPKGRKEKERVIIYLGATFGKENFNLIILQKYGDLQARHRSLQKGIDRC